MLAEKNYTGPLSYEAPNPVAWARDPSVVARTALEATRALISAASPRQPPYDVAVPVGAVDATERLNHSQVSVDVPQVREQHLFDVARPAVEVGARFEQV